MESVPKDKKRRTLIQWMTGLFLSLWGIGFLGAIASYLTPPARPRSSGRDILSGGESASLMRGMARLVRHGNEPIYVVRLQSGDIIAVSALCTHFRCVLNWNFDGQVFSCPCHDGTFNSVGEVMSGLPSKALKTFDVEVRRGEVLIRV